MSYVIKRQVNYKAHKSAVTFQFPALFTEKGVLISHLRFLYTKRNKSQSWLERNCFAIELLLKFINNQTLSYQSATELLRAFVDALCFGTVENEQDPTGLYWRPRKSEDVNVLLGHITSYCDYLDEVHGEGLPKLNPMRKATHAEERLRWCAYYRRHSRCFLNHLNKPSAKELSYVRGVNGPERHLLSVESVYRFPEEYFNRLFNDGFKSSCGHQDYASQLIVMLMHYGGLRLSECFQIYVNDISIDPKTGAALVSVFHPSDGKAPETGFNNRRDYLATKFRLSPRNEYPRNHRLHAGWKQPLLTNRNLSFEVMFFPAHKAIEFTLLLQKYLSLRVNGHHPFLFSNSRGDAETKKNFIQKHSNAVTRIGLITAKSQGTTCHGHRHSYGYRLREYGFNQLEIQKAMHHKSPDSCLAYIRPTDEEVRQRMRCI
ncbi:gamma-mobile-trio recombinase GmtY [Photobacterium chitinilyticum]|uniref:Site-specific integrase n=1 Tax=Photobacterium chitinilyticum TaxID=2485123 RepID=A0A444JMQ2_9GAMM|nr:gamma-mobile-trio recombinase GmtY [Photobacterium chitinilyticum]RWX54335.1 site-specific integrase [Photobacterium chitinilyticum]